MWRGTDAYLDFGDHTLLFQLLRGRGRHGDVEIAMPTTHLWTWRDGLTVYFKGYAQREDALRELGVSKDQLEPIGP